ncbi:hypothetical protein ACFFX0_20270 [Citricoccus parietis]|uniref:Uncharacterized protein n=1 Tax=Citricoccus parietis TaxID=592307 RepID=A0ABV5G397_9MICC
MALVLFEVHGHHHGAGLEIGAHGRLTHALRASGDHDPLVLQSHTCSFPLTSPRGRGIGGPGIRRYLFEGWCPAGGR